jgi:hypothetical protein
VKKLDKNTVRLSLALSPPLSLSLSFDDLTEKTPTHTHTQRERDTVVKRRKETKKRIPNRVCQNPIEITEFFCVFR